MSDLRVVFLLFFAVSACNEATVLFNLGETTSEGGLCDSAAKRATVTDSE